MLITVSDRSALIITDVQKDFCPGGALPVHEGDRVVPVLNAYQEKFSRIGSPIVFTRDWHPRNHSSFVENGGIWPVHCVQNTDGAQFHPELQFPGTALLVSKATDPNLEAYSSFDGTRLFEMLKRLNVETLFIGGLTTDYCVKCTALDGVNFGFSVYILKDAIRGVNVNPGDSEKAIEEMSRAGIRQATLNELA